MLPKDMLSKVSTAHLMTEDEWRRIGVQQSRGWIHYMIHNPGNFILVFPFISHALNDMMPKMLWFLYRTPCPALQATSPKGRK